jgi:hypothetical protein
MKSFFSVITLLISVTLHSQYYYNDIIGTKEISERMKAFVAAKVQSVTAAGYDARGNQTTDFNEWQDVQGNGTILKITTRHGQSASRIYYNFDNKGKLVSARDSSSDIQNLSEYSYDINDRLVSIKTTINDAGKDFDETEEHQWYYGANRGPEKMLRILNGKDTTEYRFTLDDHGNVADETMYRRFREEDTTYYYVYEDQRVYYYYDDDNRLSDIVRYDKKTRQLLPDVMFEYDEKNRVIQRRTTISTWPPDYLIWRYLFNEQGLKTKEALFSKAKELKGRIDYTYTFMP